MSAIAGIVDFSRQAVEPQQLHAMTAALAHRGPDGINHFLDGSVALAQCMLHTTPESLTEVQPLISVRSGCVLVMDGRFDNWEELRQELQAPQANDADLAMLAYERWGADFPGRLDGDFALALWDPQQQTLHCSRDIFGRRPFYYHWDGQRFAFASELKPLLSLPWITKQLNEGMVAEYLGYEWYSRVETFWQGVLRIEPAHRLAVDAAGPHIAQHWQPDLFSPLRYATDEEYIAHYRNLYEDCVRRISRSHLPVAYEVSGGLDSSATYAMAVHLHELGRLPAPATKGYTMAFPPGTPAHELDYARAVALHTGTTLEECAPTLKPLAWYLQRAAERCDLPDIPNGAMMLTMLDTARAQGARVMIGGYGGDEYTGVGTAGMYYADLLSELQWTGLLQAFRRDVPQLGILRTLWWFWRQGVAVLSPPSIKQFIRNFRSVPMLNPWWLDSRLKTVLAHRRVVNAGERNIKVARHSQRRILRFYEHADLHHMMELSDYRSARCGMEVRSAYYNKCMLQFALSTGEWTRQRGMEHRWLHRQAMRDLLPAMVRNRRDKADFGEMVFRTNEEIRREHLNAVLVRREQWLDKDAIEKLRTAPATLQDIDVRDWVLWYLVCCDAVAG